jgi:hypothetical protein
LERHAGAGFDSVGTSTKNSGNYGQQKISESRSYDLSQKESMKYERSFDERSKLIDYEYDDSKPKITMALKDLYVPIYDNVEFYCEYISKSKVIDVSWYYNGKLLIKQAFTNKYMIKIEEGKSKLSVLQTTLNDVGVYEIRITNSYGMTACRAFLSVNHSKFNLNYNNNIQIRKWH